MIRDGHYEATVATVLGTTNVSLTLCNGHLTGMTQRGVPLAGSYKIDQVRNVVCFDLDAHMPPLFIAITGLEAPPTGRTVRVQGEAALGGLPTRFSISFAARAVDVILKYVRPLDLTKSQGSAVA